jgi:hypothetical protein
MNFDVKSSCEGGIYEVFINRHNTSYIQNCDVARIEPLQLQDPLGLMPRSAIVLVIYFKIWL